MSEKRRLERVSVHVKDFGKYHEISLFNRKFRWFTTSQELMVCSDDAEWLTIAVQSNVDQAIGFVVGVYYAHAGVGPDVGGKKDQ